MSSPPNDQVPDLNDTIRMLLRTAEAGDTDGLPTGDTPVAEAAREARAQVGLQILRQAVERAERSQDKAEAGLVVSALLADKGALEVLGLGWSRHWPDVESLLIQLRKLVVAGDAKSLERAIKESAAAHEAAREAAPVPPKRPYGLGRDLSWLKVPWGWQLDGSGVHQETVSPSGVSTRLVACSPCVVSEVLVALSDGSERVRLEWRRGDQSWVSKVLPRSEVRDARKILSLADSGLDVGTDNARDVVRWLAEQERENTPKLRRSWVSDRLGWQGDDGVHGFLWGEQLVSEIDGPPAVVLDVDEGARQISEAYTSSGTLDGWKQAIEPVLEFPSVMLGIYASLAAPFLALLPRAPNAILDWSGSTSHGKTSCLSTAASCWGAPEKGQHLVHSWDNSPTYLERAAQLTRHLPLIVDDTKDARNPEIIERILFAFSGGSGRGRGSLDGLRRTAESRGVLLSSGEQPVTAFGSAAGARARVLTLRGRPFDDGDKRALVEQLLARLAEHHGHAGPAVLRWLTRNRASWSSVRRDWEAARERWGGGSRVAVLGRFAGTMALLECGANALHQILGVREPERSPLEYAWAAAQASASDADRPAAALAAVYSWAVSNSTDFYGRHAYNPDESPRRPAKGWAGKWDDTAWWDEISWFPEALERILSFQGFRNPEEVLASWQERGWIDMDGRNRGRPRRVDSLRVRLICISRKTLTAVVGDIE